MLQATVLLPLQPPGSSSAGPGRATSTKGLFAQSQWIKGNLFSLRHYLPVVATMALLESRQGGEMDKLRAWSTAIHCPSKGTTPPPVCWSRQPPGVRGGRRRRRNGFCCHLAPNTRPQPGLDPKNSSTIPGTPLLGLHVCPSLQAAQDPRPPECDRSTGRRTTGKSQSMMSLK